MEIHFVQKVINNTINLVIIIIVLLTANINSIIIMIVIVNITIILFITINFINSPIFKVIDTILFSTIFTNMIIIMVN